MSPLVSDTRAAASHATRAHHHRDFLEPEQLRRQDPAATRDYPDGLVDQIRIDAVIPPPNPRCSSGRLRT